MGKIALDMTMGKMALDITPTINLPEVLAVMMERQVAFLSALHSPRKRRRSCLATQESKKLALLRPPKKRRCTFIGRHNLRIRPSPGFPSPSCRRYPRSAFTPSVSFDSFTVSPCMLFLRAATTQVCNFNFYSPLVFLANFIFNFRPNRSRVRSLGPPLQRVG